MTPSERAGEKGRGGAYDCVRLGLGRHFRFPSLMTRAGNRNPSHQRGGPDEADPTPSSAVSHFPEAV